MIKVKITANTVQDFRRQLEELLSMSTTEISGMPAEKVKIEKPKLKVAPKEEDTKPEETKAEDGKVEPGPGEGEGENIKKKESGSGPITMDNLRDATIAQNEKGNKDQVKKILSSFKATRLGELAESDWANYLAKLKAL